MHTKLKGPDTGFDPITIEVTLETAEQVAALYAFCNVSMTCTLMSEYGVHLGQIRDALSSALSLNQIPYGPIHSKLIDQYREDQL